MVDGKKFAMIDYSEPGGGEVALRVSRQARMSARSSVLRVARATGVPVISQPVWPGTFSAPDYAEPSSGLRIARALESAATSVTCEYVRYAREAGLTWYEIGAELGIGSDLTDREISVGDAAFNFAVGALDQGTGLSDIPTFPWVCPACQELIHDRGPSAGAPWERESGHAVGCHRMAEESAAWNADQISENEN
jgi:hypothetical protein